MKVARGFAAGVLMVSGCGIRTPLTAEKVRAAILNSEEFRSAARCPDGKPATRELVSAADSTPVSCESSISQCYCAAKFRWRWRCASGDTDGYVELRKDKDEDWRVLTLHFTRDDAGRR